MSHSQIMKPRSDEIKCPQCTILNNINNDECYMCGLPFRSQEPGLVCMRFNPHFSYSSIQININREAGLNENDNSSPTTKTCTPDSNTVEIIWAYFTVFMYTLYTVIVTWKSETIIKIIIYLCLLFALFCLYRLCPFILRGIKASLNWIKKSVRACLKNIFTIETNPLVWILGAVLIAWCTKLTFGIEKIDIRLSKMEMDVNDLTIDMKYIKEAVIDLQHRVGKLEFGFQDLQNTVDRGFETLGANIQRIDDSVNWVSKKMNDTYTPWIEQDGWMKASDTFVRETIYSIFRKLSSKPLTRAEFGLGCFMKGTMIQIRADGQSIKVEELRDGDFVYHPLWKEQVKIKTVIAGEESGKMYKVTTNDSLSVTVTETHPMIMCDVHNDVVISCERNVAARDVFKGNLTRSVHGYGMIESVEEFLVDGVMVYNFMSDVDEDVNVNSRIVVANGLYTLDLFAQMQHH